MNHEQLQFLDVIDVEEAHRRFDGATAAIVPSREKVALGDASGRILAEDVRSSISVTSFDRSNVDGFAVRSEDTWGASETEPVRLPILEESSSPGRLPAGELGTGWGMAIATGAPIPRGANAVVMVEHTNPVDGGIEISRAAVPGANVTFAGTDISQGETVLREGQRLSAREIGVLASIGQARIRVYSRPRVAIISTGDELIDPEQLRDELEPGKILDSNSYILAEAVREAGGRPFRLGICPDDEPQLREIVRKAIDEYDVVLMSGGTSKGAGDISYRVVRELDDPGIVVHGVALKPGKPVCLAVHQRTPVIILPGFPTSAIFTFHEFVAPLLRRLSGARDPGRREIEARIPFRINSDKGRTEFVLVMLVPPPDPSSPPTAWPIGKGSGSVTTFSNADAFIRIDRLEEIVEHGDLVTATLLAGEIEMVDLVAIGSQCRGLEAVMAALRRKGITSRSISAGSAAGLEAVRRGECDLAGIHLYDPKTERYNSPFVDDSIVLVPGYIRRQGIVFRKDDPRFDNAGPEQAASVIRSATDMVMVNRNRGSGTRALIDGLLDGERPDGYWIEPRSHEAVANAVVQKRADWGVCIESVAKDAGLGFIEIADEHYDFAIPIARLEREPVQAFLAVLRTPALRERLQTLGFRMREA